MKKPNKLILLSILLFLHFYAKSQTLDTIQYKSQIKNIKQIAGQAITDRFPSTRFLDVQYEYLPPSDFKSKLYETPWTNGKHNQQNRIKVAVNLPVYKKNKLTITGSARYKYSHLDFNDLENISSKYQNINYNNSVSSHFFTAGLNATYISKAFGKIIVYNANISVDGSQKGAERIKGSLLLTMPLKRNATTSIAVGFYGAIDKMSRIPVIPFVTIDHKLGNDWALAVAFPRYIYFRKELFKNGRLSLGSELDSESFYIYPKEMSQVYLYKKNEIRSGFLYEHHLHRRFILSVRGGSINTFSTKLVPKNKSDNKKIMTETQDMNMYINVGFSYNIFGK